MRHIYAPFPQLAASILNFISDVCSFCSIGNGEYSQTEYFY